MPLLLVATTSAAVVLTGQMWGLLLGKQESAIPPTLLVQTLAADGNPEPSAAYVPPKKDPTPPAPRVTPQLVPFADKYLDRSVQRVAGKINVAVHVLAMPGRQVQPLRAAAQRALRERGYGVVSLFKPRFIEDQLDRRVYEGSPSLVKQLELRKYCDDILLGSVRVTREPGALEGFFIAELALNLRVISAQTGEVMAEKEVVEKGGGDDADASIVDALRKLETSVELQLGEWSWM